MVAQQSESSLDIVRPTPITAARQGPRLGLPSSAELDALLTYGQIIVKSGLAPAHIKTAEAAIVMMRYGHQLGLDEFTALQNMYIQNGKPTAFASLLHALILRDHGGDAIRVMETSPTRCVLSCGRRDSQTRTEISYTIEEAKTAKLTDKATWQQYPADMLFSRAVSRSGRMLFRDSTLGLYTPEELGSTWIEAQGQVVEVRESVDTETGEIVEAAPANRLARLHGIGAERGLDHDALHRIGVFHGYRSLTELTPSMLADFETMVTEAADAEITAWATDWYDVIAVVVAQGSAADLLESG